MKKNPKAEKSGNGKAPNGQGQDRKRILAAIRMAQKFNDTEEAACRLETESGEVYERMVDGKDLEGLRALKKIFMELKPTFKGSTGFKDILRALDDRIHDFASELIGKASEAN